MFSTSQTRSDPPTDHEGTNTDRFQKLEPSNELPKGREKEQEECPASVFPATHPERTSNGMRLSFT